MNKRAFTLIELLAVITLIALLALLVVPTVINSVNRNKVKLSETTTQLIYSAAGLYLDANQTDYPKVNKAVYCLPLRQLSDSDFLEENLTDIESGEKINLNYVIESKYNGYKYEYEILKSATDCKENIIRTDMSISINALNFYRDSISESNKREKMYGGFNYIIEVPVKTSKINNETTLNLKVRKYNEELTWGTGTATVQEDNITSFEISVPNTAHIGEYVIEVSTKDNDLKVTKNFSINVNPIILFMGD